MDMTTQLSVFDYEHLYKSVTVRGDIIPKIYNNVEHCKLIGYVLLLIIVQWLPCHGS
jgi:hypothetical protein